MIPLKISLDVEVHPLHMDSETRLAPNELVILAGVGILQKGTDSGKPVVILRVNLPDGRFVLAQTTLRLFNTAMIAFKARYGEFLED